MEKLLKAEHVADHLGMHVKTLYKLLRENQIALNFIRVNGRTIAFLPADVEAYLNDRKVIRTGDSPRKPRKTSRPKTYGTRTDFLSDAEARAFFAGIKTDEDGNYIVRSD